MVGEPTDGMVPSYLSAYPPAESDSHPKKPRICAVSYLNTVPLVWGLLHDETLRHGHELSFRLPAECAEALRNGTVDVGLVPAVELLRQPLEALPGVGIAALGPVRSILLISRCPISEIRTLATDSSSRTSVMLSRIILEERYGVSPMLISRPPVLDDMLAEADAALIIGDPALRLEPNSLPYPQVIDLGAEWFELTGLPMVFAVWAARRGFASTALAQMFKHSYAYGAAHLEDIVRDSSAVHGVTPAVAREYLTRYIKFPLGPREMAGLNKFLLLARVRENQSKEKAS